MPQQRSAQTQGLPQREATPGVYSSTEELLRLRHIAQDLILATRRKSAALLAGSQHTVFRGRGMEFAEVRPYQYGDDIRNIDWRVTARTQRPHTKLFQEERERPVFVMVDLRSPMFFGSRLQFKSVFATELAALIGWIAQANNDRIGALLFGDKGQRDIRARRGKHAVLELLHQLLIHNHALSSPLPQPNAPVLADMLSDLRRVAKPGSALFVLSDFHDFNESCQEPLATLRKHCDTTLIHLYDPLEKQLPQQGLLPISDGDHQRLLDGSSRQLRRNFTHLFDERIQLMRQLCNNAGIPLVSSDVQQSAEHLTRELFSRRGQGRRTAHQPAKEFSHA